MTTRRETTIGEILDHHGGEVKTGPFGTTLKASEYSSFGVPVISVGEIGHGEFRIHDRTPFVDTTVTDRLPEYLLQLDDIVFARKGSIDRSAIVGRDQVGWFLGSDGIRLRMPPAISARFIRYWVGSPIVRDWLGQNSTGSTMASLNQGTVRRIPIILPPLPEQREIAAILGALDNKIEVNRKASATLEAMARALYRSWFVDFDPVWAKLENRPAAHMPPQTAALFPDSFDDAGLPLGWELTTIGEVADIVGGGTPSTKQAEFWDDGHHLWATPKDLSNNQGPVLLNTERRITDVGLAKISSGLLPTGSLLLSSRAPIGYLVIARRPVAINQGFIGIRETSTVSGIEAYHWCVENMELIHANANGSTFQEIAKKNFRPLPYVLAPEPVRQAFNDQAGSYFSRIANFSEENQTLATLRDSLLPRLMSGELRVGDARAQVEEVA